MLRMVEHIILANFRKTDTPTVESVRYLKICRPFSANKNKNRVEKIENVPSTFSSIDYSLGRRLTQPRFYRC